MIKQRYLIGVAVLLTVIGLLVGNGFKNAVFWVGIVLIVGVMVYNLATGRSVEAPETIFDRFRNEDDEDGKD